MAKGTFSRLASMINAVTNINGIITEIEAAFQNTLSRDGSSPNQMNANLDMNSNRILNLPQPLAGTEPVRKEDLATFITPITDVIWVWQVKRALASLGYFYTVEAAIDATPTNQTYITWSSGTTTYKTDSLHTLIKNTISLAIADQVYDLAPTFLP